MTFASIVTLIICSTTIAIYCYYKNAFKSYGLFKVIASFLLLFLVVISSYPFETQISKIIPIAITLGFIGDICLVSSKKYFFILGMLSFLLGHIAYGFSFVLIGVSIKSLLFSLLPFVLVTIFVIRKLAPFLSQALVFPTYFYIATLLSMVALSTAVYFTNNLYVPMIGAICFAISDLFVARQRFIKASILNKVFGLPLYFVAQLILGLSIISIH